MRRGYRFSAHGKARWATACANAARDCGTGNSRAATAAHTHTARDQGAATPAAHTYVGIHTHTRTTDTYAHPADAGAHTHARTANGYADPANAGSTDTGRDAADSANTTATSAQHLTTDAGEGIANGGPGCDGERPRCKRPLAPERARGLNAHRYTIKQQPIPSPTDRSLHLSG